MRHAGGASGEHLGGVDGGAGLRGRDAHGQHHRRRHQAECHAQRAVDQLGAEADEDDPPECAAQFHAPRLPRDGHHGLAAGVQQAVGLQLLQHAAGHLARAADQARQFLARDAQLAALRMAHRLRLLRQVVQGAHDPVGNVQERQAAGLAAGVEQALGDLLAQRIQQARGVGRQRAEEQLVQAFVADLGQPISPTNSPAPK
ncbi:hypothetical protein G6F35_013351 [Rhizopus arrhizus]|nr:hypothetical protein G6F35_013351 [Rhizopus arrhizus]